MNNFVLVLTIAIGAVTLSGCELFRSPKIGNCTESWTTENDMFRIRVNKHAEENGGYVGGAYFIFQSAPKGQENWANIMIFRHDDPVEIPREQVRFVCERIGYVFIGNKFAVTADGGITWSIWDAIKNLPNWSHTRASIKDVQIEATGDGLMELYSFTKQKAHDLRTKDFGKSWDIQ